MAMLTGKIMISHQILARFSRIFLNYVETKKPLVWLHLHEDM